MAGWLSGLPAAATGLGACGALTLIFGVGLYVTYWRGPSRSGCKRPARRSQPVGADGWLAGVGHIADLGEALGVAAGDPFMPAQVLVPGGDDRLLDDAVGVGGVCQTREAVAPARCRLTTAPLNMWLDQ